jgi:sulfite exporter TauE/SafE
MSDHREHRHHDREPHDPLVEETEEERSRSAAARLFDIRRVIGGLFVVYGVIVGLIGLFDSPADIAKAQGVRINLWAGLLMLLFGLLMLAWQWLRPTEAPEPQDAAER